MEREEIRLHKLLCSQFIKAYKLTQGRKVGDNIEHDWFTEDLQHMVQYGNKEEAIKYLLDARKYSRTAWSEVYNQAGVQVIFIDGKLINRA